MAFISTCQSQNIETVKLNANFYVVCSLKIVLYVTCTRQWVNKHYLSAIDDHILASHHLFLNLSTLLLRRQTFFAFKFVSNSTFVYQTTILVNICLLTCTLMQYKLFSSLKILTQFAYSYNGPRRTNLLVKLY